MNILKTFLTIIFLITVSINSYSQTTKPVFNEVKIVEVIQVNSYTYMLVTEKDSEKWIVVPSLEVKVGDTYFYSGGMEMPNFKSKELDRTFESVLFLSYISKNSIETKKQTFQHSASVVGKQKPTKSKIEKQTLKIVPVTGGISIGELFKNKKEFDGKTLKIRGQVTKFSSQIMRKNWIHLQDGTEYNNKFDLIVTSNAEVNVGDIITIEGIVSLDKDFGYGYFYELIIENSILVE